MKRIDTAKLIMDETRSLMKSKSIDKISVTDICAACEMSRRTFYKYFLDKYDVISRIYEQTISGVFAETNYAMPIDYSIGRMMEVMIPDKAFYINALKYRGQNSIEDQMYEHIYEGYSKIIRNKHPDITVDESLQFEIRFTAHAGTGCMLDWIKTGMESDPYDLARKIASCIPENLFPLL